MDILKIDPTNLNTIVTIIGIIVGVGGVGFAIVGIKKIRHFFLRIFFGHVILDNDYYSTNFLVQKIKQSKETIRILCVRNQRINEPDIIREFKNFLSTNKDGIIELYVLSPRIDDNIIEEIMVTLPVPPSSVAEYRSQVATHITNIKNMYSSIGVNEKSRIKYFEYKYLPLKHMCQFDNEIYLGFQMFRRRDEDKSLLRYSSLIRSKSKLGKKLIEQFGFLQSDSRTIEIPLG